MSTSPNLGLPFILAAQAQKHVTHNEAIRGLDAVVQLMVLDRNLAAAPASPADGARYIVAAAATGVWAGHLTLHKVHDHVIGCKKQFQLFNHVGLSIS